VTEVESAGGGVAGENARAGLHLGVYTI
jgi:hypothetical protein